MIQGETYLSP